MRQLDNWPEKGEFVLAMVDGVLGEDVERTLLRLPGLPGS